MYYPNTNAILYVIDSHDKARFSKAAEELNKVLEVTKGDMLEVDFSGSASADSGEQAGPGWRCFWEGDQLGVGFIEDKGARLGDFQVFCENGYWFERIDGLGGGEAISFVVRIHMYWLWLSWKVCIDSGYHESIHGVYNN